MTATAPIPPRRLPVLTPKPTVKLSPTEQRLFNLFLDGMAHRKEEMIFAIDPDGLVEWKTVQQHLSQVRLKIAGSGLVLETIWVLRQAQWRLFRDVRDVRGGGE